MRQFLFAGEIEGHNGPVRLVAPLTDPFPASGEREKKHFLSQRIMDQV